MANVPYSRELLNSACHQRAWHWYIGFLVSLENEYKTNIGVTNDDIVHNMRRLIELMRNDLKKTN